MNWIKNQLGQHSTQIALGVIVGAVAHGIGGTMTWQAVGASVLGALIPLLTPASQ